MTQRFATSRAAALVAAVVALAGFGAAPALAADVTPPVITVPADLTITATGPTGAPVPYNAVATDAVDGVVPVTCTPTSGSTFPLGPTVVHCSATDAAMNTATKTFNVTVKDMTLPVITTPADLTVAPKTATGSPVTFTATATDDVDGTIAPGCVPASGATFPIGATTVTCTATDKAGNAASKSFKVTVSTPTGPTLTTPPDRTVGATGPTGDVVTYAATATDAIDGNVPVTCTPPSGATFPIGMTTVACTATNTAGKTSSRSFVVTVDPVESTQTDGTLSITSASVSRNVVTAAVSCAGPDTVVCDFTVQLLGPLSLAKKRTVELFGGDDKTFRVRLDAVATLRWRKHKKLSATLRVRQTKDDGSTTTKTRKVTFKR